MSALEKHIEEIKRLQGAIKITESKYLINDYSKQIKKLFEDLREYCQYRGYRYNRVLRRNGLEDLRKEKR